MTRERKAKFESEAELCATFSKEATRDGKWVAYDETGGFDILLARKDDGFQIGVEAKLALNNAVVCQALPDRWSTYSFGETGPDCRAVLVPAGGVQNGLTKICGFLGITVIQQGAPLSDAEWRHHPHISPSFRPALPDGKGWWSGDREWQEWCPVKRIKLPDYIPDSGAGHSAPIKLTEWKIKAIKMAVLLEMRPVGRGDFKALQLDPQRWTQLWLAKTPAGYVASDGMPGFKHQHPEVYRQIKADAKTWMSKAGIALPETEAAA
jgi:hypothetical protein